MPFQNDILLGASADAAFNTGLVDQSAWFDGSADYLSFTPGVADTRTRSIVSFWVQFTAFGAVEEIFAVGTTGSETDTYGIRKEATDELTVTTGNQVKLQTTRKLRDPGWYHIVVSNDTPSAAANQFRMWINGEEETDFNIDNGTTASGNIAVGAALVHRWGYWQLNTRYGEFYLAQATVLTGVSIQNGDYAIADFGETYTLGDNGSTWVPKADASIVALANSAGGNSFCLTSSIGDGTDASSNGNNFTPTSMSHAANGSDNTPSNVHAFFNPINSWNSSGGHFAGSLTRGAREYTGGSGNNLMIGTQAVSSGVWYWEVECVAVGTTSDYGVVDLSAGSPNTFSNTLGDLSFGYSYRSSGNKENNGSSVAYGASWTTGDVIGVKLDLDAGDLTFYKNGSSQGVAYSGLSGTFAPAVAEGSAAANIQAIIRISSDDWTQTPSGIDGTNVLNTANGSTPEHQGADYFNALTYTGDGVAIGSGGNSITGVGFEPDLVWIKDRDNANSHRLYDVLRGAGERLFPDRTDTESSTTEEQTSFDSDGFTVGSDSSVNGSGTNYASWNWLANGAGVSNTDGSITSTVSAADAGHFSIGTYTGTGANATVGHGLGGVDCLIVKNRDQADAWAVYHKGVAADAETDYIVLNTTAAAVDDATFWQDTAPTSTVFSIGTAVGVNTNTEAYVFYAFRSVPGLCLVDEYEGNGSTDGPYISCGFKPRWILYKRTNSTGSWTIIDTARDTYNVADARLFAESSSTESATTTLDVLGDGFKLRTSAAGNNGSGDTHIFIAIADVAGGGDLPPIPGR